MTPDPLSWVQHSVNVWCAENAPYRIVAVELPERDGPRTVYLLRRSTEEEESRKSPTFGYLLDEASTLTGAMSRADTDWWATMNHKHASVPGDYPAFSMKRFFWPISEGTSQAALVITSGDRGPVAQVIGMAHQDDDMYGPVVLTELPVISYIFDPTQRIIPS